jgi:glycosyltransferase involved in cell wall biosynthesis
MRILVLTDLYPPAATGGYERSCADVVDRWRRAGHAVTVLTTRQPDHRGPGHVDPAAATLRELPFLDSARAGDVEQDDACSVVARVLSRDRPDVVSVWNLARVPQQGVLAAVHAAGVPVVIVACDGWLAEAPQQMAPPGAGSHVVWVSEQLRAATPVPDWVPAAQSVVGSGIDTATFGSRARRPRPWGGRLLYVGRLSPAKGVDDAIAALGQLPAGVTLDIVGAGSAERRAEFEHAVTRAGLGERVTSCRVDRAHLPPVYRGADALVFPSRWAEPFGLVPLEAMACSVPVVATGTGGSAGYLEDGVNALLVPPGDPAAIAAAVRRLAAGPALRARLVRHGLRTSRAHGIDAVADALARVLRRAARVAS